MENSRRVQKDGDQWNEVSRRKPQGKRPPRGIQGSWQQSVPSWEKAFCKTVGLLDWETILDMKKFAYLSDNVMKWDCSAGEEAFHNAKNRFWAQLHGVPCDIPLPDPDLYIDEIDWDCKVDSDLVLDLDSDPKPDENHDPVIIFGDALIPSDVSTAPGWGEEENFHKDTNFSLNNHEHQWEPGWMNIETTKQGGWANGGEWEHGWDNSAGWNCVSYHHHHDWKNRETTKESGWSNGGEWGHDWNNSGGWNFDSYHHLHKEESQRLEDGWGSGWKYDDYQKESFEDSKGRRWHAEKDWSYNQQKQNYTDLKWGNGNAHYNSFYNSFSGSYRRGNEGGRYKGKYKNFK